MSRPESPEGEALEVEWCPSGELPYVSDHFPGKPLIPAFAQLAYLRGLITEWLEISAAEITVRSMKFLSPIKPDTLVKARVERKVSSASDQARRVFAVSLVVNDTTVTRGELVLA
jgi:3-hydroxymyristoyl/3-hydroxydecanoyl-(acyl carrier protein) dehydratase